MASFALIKLNFESLYMIMAYVGILIALLCFIFFVLMRGENRDTAFPKVVASYVLASAAGIVLMGGLTTCISAFQLLLVSDIDFNVYLIAGLLVWIVGVVNVFLALIPKKDVPIAKSKIYRIFTLYLMLPLYILLIGILLIYLAKIIITLNMPVGEINWYASFASIFFIFILMSVMQYPDKLARLFVKYGGYFLIPVLVMQAFAVFVRINAYGLTTPRTVSLVLIFISMLFIGGAIVIPKHLNKIAFLSGIITLIVTVTPLNIIDMPVRSQTNILKTTLEANGMLQNGTVIPNENVSEEDKEKILSAYEYLKYDADKLPDFINDYKTETELFGFSDESNRYDDDYTYCRFYSEGDFTISGYDVMIEVNNFTGEDYVEIQVDDSTHKVDLKKVAQSLYTEYGEGNNDLDVYVIDENTALIVEYFTFGLKDDETSNYNFSGYVLIKK